MGINPYNENFESGGYFFNATNRDITIVRGDTMSFGFEVQGLGGEIPSAVYFTAKETAESSDNLFALSLQDHITIRDYDSETDIYTFGLRLPPDKTYNLDLGKYFYDLEIQVNQDIFTILRGRLELVADITRGGAPSPTPQYESGDDIAYPVENIPLGSVKLYTEQTISDIAQGVLEILGEDEPIIPAEIVNKIDDIKEIIDPSFTPLKNGKTNLWVTVDDDTLTVTISFKQTVSEGTGITFGDGTAEQTTTGSGAGRKEITHTYERAGSYIISIRAIEGSYSLGYSQSYRAISGSGLKSNTILQFAEIACELNTYCFDSNINLKKASFERSVMIGNYAFSRCSSLMEINFAYPCEFGSYMIYYTTTLKKLMMPANLTSIPSNSLGYAFGLRDIELDQELETIASGAFRDCSSIESLTLPASLTTLNNASFGNCTNLRQLTVEALTPPSLNGSLTIEKVFVPTSALADYQSAQYWSDLNLIGY